MLSVHDYDLREQQVAETLPNRVIEMVNPVVFASEGYPTRVRHERALWRYVDVMHEARFEGDFKTYHDNGLTAREFDWLKSSATLIQKFSRRQFGRSLTSRGSLLRALQIFRSIVDATGPAPLRVFEAGPGSGALGCLFIQNGWGFAATDITQAFYILQSNLWDFASDGGIIELASPNAIWDGAVRPGRPVHIPWWEFFRMMPQTVPQVDIVTSNHALAEMHPNSLAFTLRLAHEMLRGEGLKLFIFEGWGWDKLQTRDKVLEAFLRFGFCLVHTDDYITVFAPREAVERRNSAILPGGQIRDHLQVARSVSLPGNTITPKLLNGRTSRRSQLAIRLEDTHLFYRALLGSTDIRTEDEKFMALIDRFY